MATQSERASERTNTLAPFSCAGAPEPLPGGSTPGARGKNATLGRFVRSFDRLPGRRSRRKFTGHRGAHGDQPRLLRKYKHLLFCSNTASGHLRSVERVLLPPSAACDLRGRYRHTVCRRAVYQGHRAAPLRRSRRDPGQARSGAWPGHPISRRALDQLVCVTCIVGHGKLACTGTKQNTHTRRNGPEEI